MILGMGIDSVEIARFAAWHTYNQKSLLRILSSCEIDYCLSTPIKSAERFAARFAVREAFYKALGHIPNIKPLPFLTVCKLIQLQKQPNGSDQLKIDWHQLINSPPTIKPHLSWSHTQTTATAIVILESETKF